MKMYHNHSLYSSGKIALKSVMTVVGIALFLIGIMTAVLIVQRQRLIEGPIAPTAPVSEPEAAIPAESLPAACGIQFTVGEPAKKSCNEACVETSECSTGLSCLPAGGQTRCRLASNPTSATCAAAVTIPDAITCINKEAASAALGTTGRQVYTANSSVNPGDNVFFVINTNIGTGTGKVTQRDRFQIIDTLPDTLEYVRTVKGPEPRVSGSTLTYNLTIADAVSQIEFVARVKPTATASTPILNTAEVVSFQTGSSKTQCSSSFKVAGVTTPRGTVSCVSKRAFTDFASVASATRIPENAPIQPGSTFVYRINVTATDTTPGPVTIRDVLPLGLSTVGDLPTSITTTTNAQGRTVVTANLGVMRDPRLSRVVQFKVKVADNMSVGNFTNTASVTISDGATTSQPVTCAATNTIPQPGTASCVEKQAYATFPTTQTLNKTLQSVKAGEQFVYRIVVKNSSTASNQAVIVRDTLPNGLTFVADSGNTTGVTADAQNKVVTANLGTMQANEERVVQFKVAVAPGTPAGTASNTVQVATGTTTSTCEPHLLPVVAASTAQCESKEALSSLTATSDLKEVKPNDTFFYRIRVKATEATSGEIAVSDTLPSSLEFIQDTQNTPGNLNTTTNSSGQTVISATLPRFTQAGTATVAFKVRAKTGAVGEIENVASVKTGTNQAVTCKNTLKVTVTEDQTNPPQIACNQVCQANADCADPDHICYTTSDGSNRCRRADNVTSASCAAPTGSTTTTQPEQGAPGVAQQPGQPVMPEELPQSGSDDWGTWLKAGLITLGIGAILLLLL
jgi:uncharacterized repeat protein (TIGR01451 family)